MMTYLALCTAQGQVLSLADRPVLHVKVHWIAGELDHHLPVSTWRWVNPDHLPVSNDFAVIFALTPERRNCKEGQTHI